MSYNLVKSLVSEIVSRKCLFCYTSLPAPAERTKMEKGRERERERHTQGVPIE